VPLLVPPSVGLREAWLEAHDEWGPGLHEDGFGLGPQDDTSTPVAFAAWVDRLAKSSGQLWWIVEGDDVVGGIALRSDDDPVSAEHGHIGYGIRDTAVVPRAPSGVLGPGRGASRSRSERVRASPRRV
jgi:predicted acetyltransferase